MLAVCAMLAEAAIVTIRACKVAAKNKIGWEIQKCYKIFDLTKRQRRLLHMMSTVDANCED